MTTKNYFTFAILLSFGALLSTGCKKQVHYNIQAASNNSLAILTYSDVFEQINAAVSSEMQLDELTNGSWNMNGSLCADVTLTPTGAGFPKTLTIDYGTGCVGPDGVLRSGMIVAQFSGNYRTEGTAIEVWFDAYTTGQYAVSGTDSLNNQGDDGSGNPVFSETLRNVVISWGTQEILWQADLTRTWIGGYNTNYTTPDTTSTMMMAGLTDDVFELTRTASGNDSNTHPFTLETTSPLMLQTGCDYIQSGTLTISPANYNVGTVDYGTGTCDKQATLEVDGEVFNFTM